MKKYFGNIISDNKNIKCENYINKCKSLDEIDKSFPTIIVGLENARKNIKNFSILKKHYPEQNLWWTFKKTERASDYRDDIKNFNKWIIERLINNVKYSYINIMKMSYNEAKRVIRYINSDEVKHIYNDRNKFILLYSEKYNTIFGFSLTTCEFCGIKKEKVLRLLKQNKNNIFIKDFGNISYNVKNLFGNCMHCNLILSQLFI